MATVNESPTIPADYHAGLEETIQNLIPGVRDPAARDRAAKEVDEAREEVRDLGVVDFLLLLEELLREASLRRRRARRLA